MPHPPPLPGPDPTPPPPLPKDPPRGRKFPCRQCGAKLEFDPAERGLKCPYCGFTEVIPEADEDQKAEVREHDLDEFLATQEGRAGATIGGRSYQVKCTGCGAVVLLEDKVATDKCPYCGTHLENKPEEVRDLIAPESVLPFTVSDREARGAFLKWLLGLWFAPTELKKLALLGQFSSVYAPFWTYDAMTYTRYRGQRGDDYTETESYTGPDGKRQTRQVTRTRWYSVSGEVRHFFDDVLIRASESLPPHLVDKLPPWELGELEPFRDEFLSGHLTERYSVSLKDGFRDARRVMEDQITHLIRRDIGGDHQRIDWRRTNYVGVTFKHTLLPMWVANYRYRDRVFQVLVNGRTRRVAGDRPWSAWKIVRLVLLIIFAILLAVVLVNKAKGQSGPKPAASAEVRAAEKVAAARIGSAPRDSNFGAAVEGRPVSCTVVGGVPSLSPTGTADMTVLSSTTRPAARGFRCPGLELSCDCLTATRKIRAIKATLRPTFGRKPLDDLHLSSRPGPVPDPARGTRRPWGDAPLSLLPAGTSAGAGRQRRPRACAREI